MWTNKQIWKFEQINENLKFDLIYQKSDDNEEKSWNSKFANKDSEIRETIIRTFDYLANNYELWIANVGHKKLEERQIPYLMSVITDLMINEEICLNFRTDEGYLVVSTDTMADIIDCKEFFEEFYHLATGFNYDIDTGIPEDETEAEIYLKRLQEEFDKKMKTKLGDLYLDGNNDPDTINSN